MITISQFKDVMASKAGGKPLSKVPNLYSMLYQAMLMVKMNVDLPSSIRTAQLTNPIYSDVDYYVVPDDLGQNAIINLRPIKPDDSFYDYDNVSQRQFTIENKFNGASFSKRYAIKYKNGVPYLLIAGTGTTPLVINTCESLTANGTWSTTGVASDLTVDDTQFYAGNASLAFKVNVGGTQGIEGVNAITADLTNYDYVLYAVYMPTVTGVTGVKIKLGQNSSNYYSATSTSDFFGNSFAIGWNLIQVPKANLSVGAGTPNLTGVTYNAVEIVGTFTVATAGFHFDNLVANTGVLAEFDYYSAFSFADINMNLKEIPTSDSDYIVMDGNELPLFINQFIEIMATDLKQQGATVDLKVSGTTTLKNMYEEFRISTPSQRQLMITKYSNRPRFDLPDGRGTNW